MTRIICQYSIVQFTPYVETGEFANVGILMIAQKEKFFGFKLMGNRHKRVTQFFNDLDASTLKGALKDLKNEFQRIGDTVNFAATNLTQDVFEEIIRPRETIIKYGEPRVIMTNNPNNELEKLYKYYIERNFVTKKYRQEILVNNMHKIFHNANIGNLYERGYIGNPDFKVNFPFIKRTTDTATKVITPLHLGQQDPTQILEYAGKWEFRLKELRKRNLMPNELLFAVDGPINSETAARHNAYEDACNMLQATNATVIPYTNTNKILAFAQ